MTRGKKEKVLVMGGLIVDKYILMDKYPSVGEGALITHSFYKVGGCAMSVTSTLKNLGVDAYPVSTIGGDEDGAVIEKYLLENNINSNCVAVEKGKTTGYSMVILDRTAERTIMNYPGCEGIFSYDLVHPHLMKEITFVYLTGYYLISNYGVEILRFIKDIKELGASIIFDPGPLVDRIEEDVLQSILELCDILMPNVNEIGKIKAKLNIKEEYDKWGEKYKIEYLIIKNGKEGIIAYKGNKKYKRSSYNVRALDITGAGDSFAAGCIYGFLNNLEFQETLNIGCACGALTTTFIGPNGTYDIKEVKRLMADNIIFING